MPSPRVVLALALAIVVATGDGALAQNLSIRHISVGQGDATLIVSPTGKTCLIDAGNASAGASIVVPLLNQLGIQALDYLVVSHYHDDHYGGVGAIVNAGFLPLVAAYDRGTVNQPSSVTSFNQYLAAVGAKRTTITPGFTINLGGGATLQCVGVNGVAMNGALVVVTGAWQEENARSIALKLTYGSFSESLCGDLNGGLFGTADAESIIAPVMGDVDVLKVNHHGALDATTATFAGTLAPEVSVISCGASPIGFPTQGVLDILLAQPTTAAVYRVQTCSNVTGGTVVGGSLLIQTNGSSYTCSGGTMTPMTRNVDESFPPPPIVYGAGDVVISEYMADPGIASDTTGEWIELRNTTANAINLRGFTVRDFGTDYFILPNLTLPAFGFVTLGKSGTSGNNGGYAPSYVWPSGAFALGNTVDQIAILSPQGTVLDALAYGNGFNYPTPTGASVERINAAGLTVPANFAAATTPFGSGDLGTPGAMNSIDQTPPRITALSPPAIAPLTIGASSVAITVSGANFVTGSVVHANGTALPTTFVNAQTLSCTLTSIVPQALLPGGICINVTKGPLVSNSVALVVGSGTNAGTVRRSPLSAQPGQTYSLVIEGGRPFAPFALFVDFGATFPVTGFPDPAVNLVLAVSPLAGSSGPLLVASDGFGLFGATYATFFDAAGAFALPGIVLPNPPFLIAGTVQAAYLDPSSPAGFRLTWARFPEWL